MRPLLLVSVLLVGCPEPVATSDGSIPQVGQPPATGGGTGGGAPPMGQNGGGQGGGGMTGQVQTGANQGAGTFGAMVPDANLDPRYKQEDITDGVTVSGTVSCADCSGKLLIRVLPPPPDQGGTDEEIHLVTSRIFESSGPFELKIPAAYSKVVLQVVDDADGNGRPSDSERMGIPAGGPTSLAGGSVSGIELVVGVFPEQTGPAQAGNPTVGGAGGGGIPATPPGGDNGPVPGALPSPGGEGAPPPGEAPAGGAAPAGG